MKITIHVGLPKTGSTSLQNSLLRSPGALASAGILYPPLPGDWQITGQHHGLAELARTGSWQQFNDMMTGYCERAQQQDLEELLLSSESFSTLPADSLRRMDSELSKTFTAVNYFCVFRSFKELLRARLKQRLVHNAISLRDSRQLASLCERICGTAATVVDTLAGKLTIVSFRHSAEDDAGFCNAVLAAGLNTVPLGIEEYHRNSSETLYSNPFSHMTGVFREAIAIELGVNAYGEAVNERLRSAIDTEKLHGAFRSSAVMGDLGNTLRLAIHSTAERVYEENFEDLALTFPSLKGTEILGCC